MAFTAEKPFSLLRIAGAVLLGLGLSAPAAAAGGTIHHVINYGQSVSQGQAGLPVISSVQRHNSLMFNGGVRARDGGTDLNTTRASLVPLAEAAWYSLGETPSAGTLEMINDLRFAENGVNASQSGIEYLGSAPGAGGQTLKQLQMGGIPFHQMLFDVYHGNRLAATQGKTYRTTAVTWIQGESDYMAKTSEADYITGLETLRLQIEWIQSAVNGRTDKIPLIAAQIADHLALNAPRPSIALAHVTAAKSNPHIYLAAPMYMLDYADAYHLTAASSKWLGAYLGLAYKRVVIDGQAWKPVQPLWAKAYGRVMMVNFHVPKPPLVFDTTQVTNPGSYGFRVVDSNGVDNPVTGVALGAGGTVVWIATARDLTAGSKLRYAWTGTTQTGRIAGARGNLRDSQGDTVLFDPTGLNKRMDNWCVIFEQTVE